MKSQIEITTHSFVMQERTVRMVQNPDKSDYVFWVQDKSESLKKLIKITDAFTLLNH